MKGRSSVALPSLLLLLTACTGTVPAATRMNLAPPIGGATAPPGPPRVALLLPLSGPQADIGATMLKAAQMALSVPGSPKLDVKDTQGDPVHAQLVASQAIAAGDRLILGPLTAPETVSVGAVSQTAGIPVLAFTSDPAAASSGVWTLGLTPGEQMRRLVLAAHDEGRQQIAAVLPPGALGDALQTAIGDAAAGAGLPPPLIQRSEDGVAGLDDALKAISGYQRRHGELESRIKALRDQTDPGSRQQAAELAARPVQPPPFDALLIGESGPTLEAVSHDLSGLDISPPGVRVLGPALWAQQASRLGSLAGAWYATLDPATRGEFVAAYQAKFGIAPPQIADFAFDAAAIARVLAGENDFSANALARAEGFSGVDGALLLLPDGHVHRALAVFQIEAAGYAHIVSPAPQDISQPAS